MEYEFLAILWSQRDIFQSRLPTFLRKQKCCATKNKPELASGVCEAVFGVGVPF